MSKYGNRKTVVDGIAFDSKREANRYSELKIMERAKLIGDLKLQPKYELLKGYTNGEGKRIRAMAYIADFEYRDKISGLITVEDTKGVKTEAYRIKKKLFEKKYHPLTIKEI